MENIKKYIPGLIFVFCISVVSKLMNEWMSPSIQLEALTIGIILGMIIKNTLGVKESFNPGIQVSLKKLLKVGIILLGFKMNFSAIANLGPRVLVMVVIFVFIALTLSILLGKALKVNTKLAALVGVGSCICGAAAIVAVTPCIDAKEEDSVLAVSIISFLGAIGVIMYSSISVVSSMTDMQYGIWSGVSLQGVAHALAAAFAREGSGEIGTFVKMARVLMLVPVSIILGFVFNTSGKEGKRASFPMYVLYFILVGVIASLGILPIYFLKKLTTLSSWCILMAMISMGLMVNFKTIKDKGLQVILLGSTIFLTLSVTTYFIILKFF
ncbi:YeiH family protein [Marinisporobacter balticus]|uniref:Putative integral membrane protein (TIGR00698 family) n=1 Tax=Marinisporobacter balticus TaxID=2018667 RepID=A0A4R2L0G4_9FIRM|nr:putative sulfate exporter family transporter [Marinisporobacter balticus]TCO78667.1 putative integral membrane protein (TIGR00698 family) [Marinisporobacter balticus]